MEQISDEHAYVAKLLLSSIIWLITHWHIPRITPIYMSLNLYIYVAITSSNVFIDSVSKEVNIYRNA